MAIKKQKSGVQDLDAALKEIRSKFGEESIRTLKDEPMAVESYSTGSIGLDAAIGVGGLPRGRIVEIYGPESSGKTTLALHVIAEAQKSGGTCAFVDVEHSFSPDYAKKIGVDTDLMLFSQPNGGEEALQITESLVRSGKVQVVVVDSVAALVPKAELEGEIGAQHVGAQARLMSQSMRILTASVGKTGTMVIFINQIRTNIGAMGFGIPETTAGGRALKFYSSVRLDIRRIAKITKNDEVVGGRVRVKVPKNKVAAPFKQTEFDLLYNEGISYEGELLALGEKYDVIKKTGMSYSYGDEKIGTRGYDSARTFLKENPKIAKKIEKEIRENL